MPGQLTLGDLQPLARGEINDVFAHPADSGLLVKVVRPGDATRRYTRKGLLRFDRRYGIHTAWMREISEYIAIRARTPEHPRFLQRYIGFAETDLGLGLIVEKVRGPDGGLAPTLHDVVVRRGLTADLRGKIDALMAAVVSLDIITGDIHPRNILCGADEAGGDRLVIIEGLGDKTLIPVNSMSRTLNRRSNERHFRRMVSHLEEIAAARTNAR